MSDGNTSFLKPIVKFLTLPILAGIVSATYGYFWMVGTPDLKEFFTNICISSMIFTAFLLLLLVWLIVCYCDDVGEASEFRMKILGYASITLLVVYSITLSVSIAASILISCS